ncbi:NAD-dependent epimerase/dehydratase family protein [Candidatus Pacearchaeota archaeon]|nr:NAD-dependent epimerase/dehydratase family protein [Candidatus Pacearchaeota archaeon]
MKILVTGGAGFIGSHTVDLLIENNHEVVIIDNLSSGSRQNINHKAKFYQANLNNFEEVEKVFKQENINVIYHFAAQINVRESVNNPINDAKENILNTLNLLELAVKYNIKHFIFSSTGGAIYGDTMQLPTNETTKEKPQSPYGCAKLSIEKYLNFYNKAYNLRYTILRYSNVYGPRQNPHGEAGVIAIFFNQMFNNNDLTIYGGIQTRDFVYVGDVARANVAALYENKNQEYNVATSIETDIIEIFLKINKYFKNRFKADYKEISRGEQKRSCLSYERIKKELNWSPLTSINEGLDKTYCWYLKR